MIRELPYDYRELAYDLYKESDDLLEQLVKLRKQRNMTQEQLAYEMNVSQAYVSKIENGQAQLVSLLTNYALEVGARIHYTVEPAQTHASGDRSYQSFSTSIDDNTVMAVWDNGEVSCSPATTTVTHELQTSEIGTMIVSVETLNTEDSNDFDSSTEQWSDASSLELANANQ